MHTYTYIHTIHTYTQTHTYRSILSAYRTFIICTDAYVNIHVSILCVCTYTYIYTYIHVHIYIQYAHTHKHKHMNNIHPHLELFKQENEKSVDGAAGEILFPHAVLCISSVSKISDFRVDKIEDFLSIEI